MSRPPRTGLDYYSLETDIFHNRKIRRLLKAFDSKGFLIYTYILTEIYRDKGCFLEWDENTAFDVSDYLNIKESIVNEVVNYCCTVGLFNKELLTSESVLTTENIQKFWVSVSKSADRKIRTVPDNISLLKRITPQKGGKSPMKRGKTPTNNLESPQRKGKKSKVKESKNREVYKNALDVLKSDKVFFEQFEMKYKNKIIDYDRMLEMYSLTVDKEELEYKFTILSARLGIYASNWLVNQNRRSKEVKKEKLTGAEALRKEVFGNG